MGLARPLEVPHSSVGDFIELTKPRLTLLAVVTTVCSFYLGSRLPVNYVLLAHTLLGTLFMAAGGAALNHVLERDLDGRMRRTSNRPLPSGRLTLTTAAIFGLALALSGTAYLAVEVNMLTGTLAAAALLSYLLVYTPLKTRTPLCTVIGAVPGALPCVMGWAAARNEIGTCGLVLFAILFLWQFPHFLAIAWMFREDYSNAGMPMLPVVEPDGGSTVRQILIWCLVLIPVSMAPTLLGMTNGAYFFISFALSLAFLGAGLRMALLRTRVEARRLLLASVLYLPLLQAAMLACKVN